MDESKKIKEKKEYESVYVEKGLSQTFKMFCDRLEIPYNVGAGRALREWLVEGHKKPVEVSDAK